MSHRFAAAALVVISACGPAGLDPGDDATERQLTVDGREPRQSTNTTATPSAIAPVPGNAARVALGRLLFWDPILSGERDVACATCHHPDFAYTDGRALSIGVGGSGLGPRRVVDVAAPHRTTRNSMTVLNAVFNGQVGPALPPADTAPMFWDNRARGLEAQARGPLLNLDEMRGPSFTEATIFPELLARLGAIPEYVGRFDDAFAGAPLSEGAVVQAIAEFERSLTTLDSSYDRFLQGDPNALSAAARRGLGTFTGHGCAGCHQGPLLSDFQLHRLGVSGSTEALRTGTLRNITVTGPYMHDGSLQTLDDVFTFYARVNRTLDPRLQQLRPLDPAERADVAAFFAALSDGAFERTGPTTVPSGLSPGGLLR